MASDPGNIFSCSSYKGEDKLYIYTRLGILDTGKTILSLSAPKIHLQSFNCSTEKENFFMYKPTY